MRSNIKDLLYPCIDEETSCIVNSTLAEIREYSVSTVSMLSGHAPSPLTPQSVSIPAGQDVLIKKDEARD